MRNLVLILLCACLLAGCQGSSAQKLAASRTTFNGAVDTLASLRMQGAFTAEQGATLDVMIRTAQASLDRWQAAVELGQDPAPYIDLFNLALREIIAQRIEAERLR